MTTVASKEKPVQATRYPATNAAVGANGRSADLRFSETRPKIITVGVTDGSIIANIITAHMTNMKTKSAADHAIIFGIAMLLLSDVVGELNPR